MIQERAASGAGRPTGPPARCHSTDTRFSEGVKRISMFRHKGEGMGKKEEYIDKLNSRVRILSSRVDMFTEMAGRDSVEQKEALLNELAEFKLKRREALEKLRRLRMSAGDSWEVLAEGLDKAWGELRETGHRITERFKQPG